MRDRRPVVLQGTIRGTRAGFAFFRPDEGGEDLFVHVSALGGALHGDRVSCRVVASDPYDFRPSAEVEEILARGGGDTGFTGTLHRIGKGWFVRPDSPLLPERLRVRLGTVSGVAGAKIRFQVAGRVDPDRPPSAEAIELLGDGDDARFDLVNIAGEASLDLRFPDDAEEEALAAVSRSDPEADRRADFREDFVLTIDPPDAKDFDDAVSITPLPGGGWRLWVHIADVTSFVAAGGALDREASRRGTSVYFPGAVVPMLPDTLSSGAASLAPGVDRRVLSVRIEFDAKGARRGIHATRGLIRSKARLHYAQAQAILDGQEEAPPDTSSALRTMARLAEVLRDRRFAEGGFELALAEAELTLGPDGVPREIHRRESLASHRLIEEFMIAANRAIGAWAVQREVPFLFRVHGEPDAEALSRFLSDALVLVPGASPVALSDLPRLRRWLEALPDSPIGRIVQRLFLRSLRKAVYAPVDIGHFGLGLRGYCHFTSPIRRYPDLFVHRRVKELLDDRPPGVSWEDADREGRTSSRAEINAQEAEREMMRLKAARFMERRLGDEYPGHIVGMIGAGLFVELDAMPIEGFVPQETLAPGFRLSDERPAFSNDRSREEYRPGDAVRVTVARVDLRARRVEFGLVRGPRPPGRKRGRERPGKGAPRAEAKAPRGRGARGRGRVGSGAKRSSKRPPRPQQTRRSTGPRRGAPTRGRPKRG